jgi:uncharacterized protein DUF1003
MARIVDRNIEALLARRQQEKKLEVFRIASPIKLPSLRQHVVCLPPSIRVRAMDRAQHRMVSAIRVRSTFIILAMFASVEAIFLSTFVPITQNRMAAQADRRAHLDLQSVSWPSTRSLD